MIYKVTPGQRLILASASQRRLELLQAFGLKFEVKPADCDETQLENENPQQMVLRLARAKANLISQHFKQDWVLGADTTVVLDGQILGKPADKAEAKRMLTCLQARSHLVWGGFCVINKKLGVEHVESHCSEVTMRSLSADFVSKYVESGEPMDKAGSYAIQGIGASIVQSVSGSYSNVVGLNLSACLQVLQKLGAVEL